MEQTKQEQFIIRRIGGTTYKVRVAFSETAAETMEEKILRMIRNVCMCQCRENSSCCSTGRFHTASNDCDQCQISL